MKRRLLIMVTAVLVVSMSAGFALAQDNKDTIRFMDKRALRGHVVRDTWRAVEVDRDGDGEVDKVYRGDEVDRVDYFKTPMSIREAYLLRSRDPAGFIAKLTTGANNVYNDTASSKGILQQVYFDIATAYAGMAREDKPGMAEKAAEAFDLLLRKIPDTRYVVRAYTELGNLYLELGRPRDAVKQFEILADGRYGENTARLSRLLVARVELAQGEWDRAERLLGELEREPDFAKGDVALEIRLLRCRAFVGQKKFAEAWLGVTQVLEREPDERVRGLAWVVLGDYHAAQDQFRSAFTAYLRTLLMYGHETDSPEKARALKQAATMLRRLGRENDARTLAKRLEG